MAITREQETLIPEMAKTMNVRMIAEALGQSYDVTWAYVTRHRIKTATVRKDRVQRGIARKEQAITPKGYFDVNAKKNWLIGNTW